MYRIWITDDLDEVGIEWLREKGAEVEYKHPTPEELLENVGKFDALIVRTATRVTEEVLSRGVPKLKVVGRAGVGVDNIDTDAATRYGVLVLNAPYGYRISTAELALGLMLALIRHLPRADFLMKSEKWAKRELLGTELYGKVLGIVGVGRIGRQVAIRANAFGMKVLGYDPYIRQEDVDKYNVRLLPSLDDLLAQVDILTLHVPLTEETKYMIGERELRMMKKGAYLINCSRGKVVKGSALYKAITEGHIAGAALDVHEVEPPTDWSLIKLPQVIATPHIGSATYEAQQKVALEVVEQVWMALQGGPVRSSVNMPSVPPEVYACLKPYLYLSEKMGRFAGQWIKRPVDEIRIIYMGDVTKLPYSLITASFVKGLLDPVLGEPVNYINAVHMANERGISVVESLSDGGGEFTNLMKVEIKVGKEYYEIAGTLVGRSIPRIVEIDGFKVDVEPKGNIILTRHHDKPGMIGKIGMILGERNINIANMYVGRKEKRGEAVMALCVDEEVPSEVLDEIRSIDGFERVDFISL